MLQKWLMHLHVTLFSVCVCLGDRGDRGSKGQKVSLRLVVKTRVSFNLFEQTIRIIGLSVSLFNTRQLWTEGTSVQLNWCNLKEKSCTTWHLSSALAPDCTSVSNTIDWIFIGSSGTAKRPQSHKNRNKQTNQVSRRPTPAVTYYSLFSSVESGDLTAV